MWKRFLVVHGTVGLIAGACLVAQAQAPTPGQKRVVGTWVRESQQFMPNADRLVVRGDSTLVVTERGKQYPGTWKALERSRIRLDLSGDRKIQRVLEWKILRGGVLRLRDASHRKEMPSFWVPATAASRRAGRNPAPPRPLWELQKDPKGQPICARCDWSEFGRPKSWEKRTRDGRTIACGVCRTSYVFVLPDGTPYQPVKLAKAPRKRRYTAFRKLVSKAGTWQLQSDRGAAAVSFNATRGTAFAAGKKWLWEEVGKDHLKVTYEGEKRARDWRWELSDDKRVVRVTEFNIGGNPVNRRTFSLIRWLP